MRTLSLPVLSLLTLASCSSLEVTRGSGIPLTDARKPAPFRKVEVSGAFEVAWTRSETPSVEVSGDDNLVPLVSTEVTGDTLEVRWKPNCIAVSPRLPLRVRLASAALAAAEVSGASTLDLKGLSGDALSLEVSGASRATLQGTLKALTVEVSGASTLDASALAAGSITGSVSGASSLTHAGKASRIDVEVTGASELKKGP